MISAGPSDVGMMSSLPAVQVSDCRAHVLQLVAHGPQRLTHGRNLEEADPERLGPPGDGCGHERDHRGPDRHDRGRQEPGRFREPRIHERRARERRLHEARLAVDHARQA